MDARLPSFVELDLETSRRGLPARVADDLGGRPVVVRALERILACERLRPPVVIVEQRQLDAARALVGDLPVSWFAHEHADLRQRADLRRARRWGKEAWRGGLAESFFTCEQGNPSAIADLYQREGWSAAMFLPAEAPFLDPARIDELATGFASGGVARKLYLSTAPPGIAGDVLGLEMVSVLAQFQRTLADVLGFVPDRKSGHPDAHFFHPFPLAVSAARGRFTVDSRAALAVARSWWDASRGQESEAGALFRWLTQAPDSVAGALPEELVHELGPDAGGSRAPRSRAAVPESVRCTVRARVLAACSERDDSLLTVGGGYHDPLLDPSCPDFLRQARAVTFGLHVDTPGAAITESSADGVLAADPDVITVDLGAVGEEALARIAPGTPGFDARVRGLETLLARRGPRHRHRAPFVVVSVVIDEASMNEFEPFFDRWHARVARVLVRGLEGRRGEIASTSAGLFAPPERAPCVRLTTQLRVEADGTVPLCARDPDGENRIGNVQVDAIASLWQGTGLRAARRAHREHRWDEIGHCGPCASWFRLD
ncbi:MAG: SPASM domain-containing protein [Planctomycetota bacterium]